MSAKFLKVRVLIDVDDFIFDSDYKVVHPAVLLLVERLQEHQRVNACQYISSQQDLNHSDFRSALEKLHGHLPLLSKVGVAKKQHNEKIVTDIAGLQGNIHVEGRPLVITANPNLLLGNIGAGFVVDGLGKIDIKGGTGTVRAIDNMQGLVQVLQALLEEEDGDILAKLRGKKWFSLPRHVSLPVVSSYDPRLSISFSGEDVVVKQPQDVERYDL